MTDSQMSGFESPQHYVASHSITMELRKRGVTDDQLAAIRFRGKDQGYPFHPWSFTWGNGMPPEAIPFVNAYCALKWLILDDPPASRDKEDAWRYVSDATIAPCDRCRAEIPGRAKTARAATPSQSHRRWANYQAGCGTLVRKLERREESIKELWPHFYEELERLELEPEELECSDLRSAATSISLAINGEKFHTGSLVRKASRLPADWTEQRTLLGF